MKRLAMVVCAFSIAQALAGDSAEIQYVRTCIGRAGMVQQNMGCIELDFDRDGDTDMDDFGEFQRRGFCLTPPATTQPTTRPVEPARPWIWPAGCACVMQGSPGGALISCQVWGDLPADMQSELQEFIERMTSEAQARGIHVPDYAAKVRDEWTVTTQPQG